MFKSSAIQVRVKFLQGRVARRDPSDSTAKTPNLGQSAYSKPIPDDVHRSDWSAGGQRRLARVLPKGPTTRLVINRFKPDQQLCACPEFQDFTANCGLRACRWAPTR